MREGGLGKKWLEVGMEVKEGVVIWIIYSKDSGMIGFHKNFPS